MNPLQGLLQARKQVSAFPTEVFFVSWQPRPLGWQQVSSDSFVWGVQDFLILHVRKVILALFLDPYARKRGHEVPGQSGADRVAPF